MLDVQMKFHPHETRTADSLTKQPAFLCVAKFTKTEGRLGIHLAGLPSFLPLSEGGCFSCPQGGGH